MVSIESKKAGKQNAKTSVRSRRAAQVATARRMGAKGSQSIELALFYPPGLEKSLAGFSAFASSREALTNAPPTRRLAQEAAWYVTDIDDLTSRVAEQRYDELKSFRGILVNSHSATSAKKDRLLGLLASAGLAPKASFLPSLRAIKRVLLAQHYGYGDAIIAQAFSIGRTLVVQDANLNYFSFHADKCSALRGLSDEQLASLEIDSMGSGLHWRNLDLDIDLEGLKLSASEELQTKAMAKSKDHRNQTALSLRAWIEGHSGILSQLSHKEQATLDAIVAGESDLKVSLVERIALLSGTPPNDLLEELAKKR